MREFGGLCAGLKASIVSAVARSEPYAEARDTIWLLVWSWHSSSGSEEADGGVQITTNLIFFLFDLQLKWVFVSKIVM